MWFCSALVGPVLAKVVMKDSTRCRGSENEKLLDARESISVRICWQVVAMQMTVLKAGFEGRTSLCIWLRSSVNLSVRVC